MPAQGPAKLRDFSPLARLLTAPMLARMWTFGSLLSMIVPHSTQALYDLDVLEPKVGGVVGSGMVSPKSNVPSTVSFR